MKTLFQIITKIEDEKQIEELLKTNQIKNKEYSIPETFDEFVQLMRNRHLYIEFKEEKDDWKEYYLPSFPEYKIQVNTKHNWYAFNFGYDKCEGKVFYDINSIWQIIKLMFI